MSLPAHKSVSRPPELLPSPSSSASRPTRPQRPGSKHPNSSEPPAEEPLSRSRWSRLAIALLAVLAIVLHLVLRYALRWEGVWPQVPLLFALSVGGGPLLWDLTIKLLHGEFGSDLLAGISIVTSLILGEYLAGTLVVLMLSGGEALESYAVQSASSVLQALSKRMPAVAHAQRATGVTDIALDEIQIGDDLLVFPHEACPVDGTVVAGRGVMDESYLTGEPYRMQKMPGASVISGAINGDTALTIRADKKARDSRYAQIVQVMHASQQQRPRLRRLGDRLGAFYTPLALTLGCMAWILSGDPLRFLAVMVVATPCPLLIAIPVAIIGSISLAARRAIIIRDPAVLEQADQCQTMIFDKTGTLTYGEPQLTEQLTAPNFSSSEVLAMVASLERYSKHPLAEAIVRAAQSEKLAELEVSHISEPAGQGLQGSVAGKQVQVTSRKKLAMAGFSQPLPASTSGLECIILIDGNYAASYRFRDAPRREGLSFIAHLSERHQVRKIVLLSGDRVDEVQYLAEQVGIAEFYGDRSPEDKLAFVREQTRRGPTMFVGDGINDAPALLAASVGVALGHNSEVTSASAGAVIMDSSLAKVDEFMHISRRMRKIALQSAVGGMALSVLGMLIASAGYLPPVAGAVLQEVIDVVAVVNALRAAVPGASLVDF